MTCSLEEIAADDQAIVHLCRIKAEYADVDLRHHGYIESQTGAKVEESTLDSAQFFISKADQRLIGKSR